jgi:hypothetical protein
VAEKRRTKDGSHPYPESAALVHAELWCRPFSLDLTACEKMLVAAAALVTDGLGARIPADTENKAML